MSGLDEGFFNKIFWVFFVVMGFLIVFGLSARAYFIDILLGIMLIALGINKLEAEMKHGKAEGSIRDMESRVRNMDSMVNDTHSMLRGTRSTHELRLHKLDNKRAEQDVKIEQNYRDLVRKIFDLENKMNVIAKAIRDAPELLEARPRSGRERTVANAVKARDVRKEAKRKTKRK
jgi:hypothetical protein